ncbi:MAG: autotransporter-associated beta strand repeat-containing protein, partial [Kiritimatiellae bacterium]|nr:autotransporter-associated beta strand repeat-containing protein [Kiritimatiellia bacterium]
MTLPVSLQAPSGKGVASVPFACSEAWRYSGSPFIRITGDGAGASAYAEFDPEAGTITNVLVTSPGNGYTTATAQISYGGWTNTVSLSLDQCLADNDMSGGLVKKGAGTLRLDAVNTYLGPTVVEEGTLRFNVANAIAAASALRVESGATADLNGKALTVSGLSGAGTVSGSLTVAGTWKIDAAKLITGETLGVNGTVTIAPGTTIHVDDPDGLLLNKSTWRTYTPFTATAISGPTTLAIDNLDPPWYATVSGSKMHFGYLNGTMVIFR